MTIPMRTHRPHTKSRKGCKTCKSRRVKCDERLPICTNCEVRKTPCFYMDIIVLDRTPSTKPSTITTAMLNSETIGGSKKTASAEKSFLDFFGRLPRSPFNQGPAIARSLLLSEYCRNVSVGLAAGSKTVTRTRIWCDVVPTLGFQHDGVSHAILAVATMSLWSEQFRQYMSSSNHLSSEQFWNFSQPYLRQAYFHYGKCSKILREELSSYGKVNVDAALACSVLLVPYGLTHSQFERHRLRLSRKQTEAYDSPRSEQSEVAPQCGYREGEQLIDLTWINFSRGMSTLAIKLLQNRPTQVSLMQPLFSGEQQIDGNDNTLLGHDLLPTILIEGESALIDLQSNLQALAPQRQISQVNVHICLGALDHLQVVVKDFTTFAKASSPQPYFRVMGGWASLIESSFVDLLASQNVTAMAVYAYFLAYMILFENLWWVGDLGVGTLQIMMDLVGGYESDYGQHGQTRGELELQKLFAWPFKMVRLREGSKMGCGKR